MMSVRALGACVLAGIFAASVTATPQRSQISTVPIDRAALAEKVRGEFLFAWNSYARLAWDHDELNPVTRTPHDWYPPAIVYMSAIDALDTMTSLGLYDDAA